MVGHVTWVMHGTHRHSFICRDQDTNKMQRTTLSFMAPLAGGFAGESPQSAAHKRRSGKNRRPRAGLELQTFTTSHDWVRPRIITSTRFAGDRSGQGYAPISIKTHAFQQGSGYGQVNNDLCFSAGSIFSWSALTAAVSQVGDPIRVVDTVRNCRYYPKTVWFLYRCCWTLNLFSCYVNACSS